MIRNFTEGGGSGSAARGVSRVRLRKVVLAVAVSCCASSLSGCRMLGLKVYTIPSVSMEPTIHKGDAVVVNTRAYARQPPADGDIVAFHHGEYIVLKRVSATAGETIASVGGMLIRNGHPLQESYLAPRQEEEPEEATNFAQRTVPAGQIFVTGDNRDQSLDSRFESFGPVALSDVIGRAIQVTTPHGATRKL